MRLATFTISAAALLAAPHAPIALAGPTAEPIGAVSAFHGRTPLHNAAITGDAAGVATLLASGADVNARDHHGATPLHLASVRHRHEVIDLLIAAGADVNARDHDGRTPLANAAAQGPGGAPELDALLATTAQRLLDAGATINAVDAAGAAALDTSERVGHAATSALLRERGGVTLAGPPRDEVDRAAYRTYAEIETLLTQAEIDHPTIAEKIVIGTSHLGRNISALRITDNIGVEEDEAEIGYVSTPHGDEIIGNEMCLYLIDHLTDNYGQAGFEDITALVDDHDIWIIPLMNPDGYVAGTRTNAQGFDLNRTFPDVYTSPINTPAGRPTEVGVIMNWKFAHSFTLTANLHGGALLANYPFDSNASGSSTYTACPDDDLFIYVSKEYSRHNLPMWNSPSFPDGITNGADWYHVNGGMQDWNYRYMGCNEVTLELNNTKQPPSSQIPTFWNENRDSMLAYLETARLGVRGVITDVDSGLPIAATVAVVGRDHDVFTDPDVGDYHRMLMDGAYDLAFTAAGYEPSFAEGVVVDNTAKATTRLDVEMVPVAPGSATIVAAPNGGETLPVNQPTTISWSGPASTAFQVQYSDNYGSQTINDGFETGALEPGWSTSGSAPWYVQSAVKLSGTYAARAGTITHNQNSELLQTVDGPGSVSFFYQVSSESGYDYFRFLIDGNEEVVASGSTGWVEVIRPLTAGTHTLTWRYDKDGSVSTGSDTAWVDDVKIVTQGADWTDVVAQTAVGATTVPWTPAATTTQGKIRVRRIDVPGTPAVVGAWDESATTFTVAPGPACPGDVDGDGDTDVFDFADLASNFGAGPGATQAMGDLTGDGFVDVFDFAELASDFGCSAN